MKFVFLFGGTSGMAAAVATDLWFGRSPDRILLDGAIGGLAGALLFRWFWNVLLTGISETFVARQRAAAAAAAAATAAWERCDSGRRART
jgi:hypothetical protein